MSTYTLSIEHCVTPDIKNISTIEFLGEEDGNWGSILVDNMTIRIQINEYGNLIWDKDGVNETEFFDPGDTITHLADRRYISATYNGLVNISHHSVSVVLEEDNCNTRNYMGKDLSEELEHTLSEEISSPSGNWEDFNKWNNRWRFYRYLSEYNQGLICPDDLTEEPKVEDY